MKKYKIFTEASGCLTSLYILNAIKEANCLSCASDVNPFNAAYDLADDFIIMPSVNDEKLWDKTKQLLVDHNIDIVIPTFDESLLGWSIYKEEFKQMGIEIIISPKETIEIFTDKWKTYLFFDGLSIPTPKTEIYKNLGLIKPRNGRGGAGIEIFTQSFQNNNEWLYITQEKIDGQEYTIDCFFDKNGKPIYIIPRKRLEIKDGKSLKSIVCQHLLIEEYIIKISKEIHFVGPVNFQAFEDRYSNLFFIEVNPRLGGGTSLAFKASENWIKLIVEHFIKNKNLISNNKINFGLKMTRAYLDVFFK
ncbi:ATP-grasp domain-containing protein [Campylobacter lari]|nr:ATP-grasp domain-containing protein [Campylobacter lari]EDP6894388.1 ATP-grasp domain-containing protein [Campylobacter lari]MCV3399586.1 ATP-grasp domain-containing protein [Campylobacter lari]HEF1154657.1 ATP-grasp domain-containing protein [Campylobacter lari]